MYPLDLFNFNPFRKINLETGLGQAFQQIARIKIDVAKEQN